MMRRRCHRLTTALFAVLSLLFSQLALASYVCPGHGETEAMRAMAEAGVPCEGMDPVQPVLCHQHCADAATNVEAVKLPVAVPAAVARVLELPAVPEAEVARVVVPPAATAEAQPPPDPLFLSTLRLRV